MYKSRVTQLYKNTDLRKGNQCYKKVNDKTDYKECHPMKLRLSKTPINLNIKLINFLDKTDRKMYSKKRLFNIQLKYTRI